MTSPYTLPGRLPGLIKQLVALYRKSGAINLPQVIESARIGLDLHTEHDNWNGGTTGHDLVLYLSLEIITDFDIGYRKDVCDKIKEDINALITRSNEYINDVHFELADDNNPEYQAATNYEHKVQIDPDKVDFWKPGLIRCFITHRDEHKAGAHKLAQSLEGYGFTCFVAHDTVMPMKEWRKEIMTGLQTMEIMLVYLSEDFHDSIWTNQEIGFALGAQKPVVCLKLGKKAPSGFVDYLQAINGDAEHPEDSATKISKHLAEALNASERLNNGIIEAFITSPDWGETTKRFDRMTKAVTKPSEAQVSRIIEGFNTNNQLRGAAYLTNNSERMVRWLKDVTGASYERHSGILRLTVTSSQKIWDDDLPF